MEFVVYQLHLVGPPAPYPNILAAPVARLAASASRTTPFYNTGVPASETSRTIHRTETIGIVIVALIILAVILARWGGVIPWSAR